MNTCSYVLLCLCLLQYWPDGVCYRIKIRRETNYPMHKQRFWSLFAILVLFALMVAGCGTGEPSAAPEARLLRLVRSGFALPRRLHGRRSSPPSASMHKEVGDSPFG